MHHKHLRKKEQGIALIISLFMLVLLFAIGIALLFKSLTEEKASKNLTDASLNKLAIQGSIGVVKTNVALAFGDLTSPLYEQKSGVSVLKKNSNNNSYSLHSMAPVGTSKGLDYNSKTSSGTANIEAIGQGSDQTTQSYMGYYHEGNKLTEAPNDLEWIIIPEKGSSINNSGSSELTVDQDAYRLAYFLIDQTGKIDPNIASTSNSMGKGTPNSFLNPKREGTNNKLIQSSPITLDSLFTNNSISSKFSKDLSFQNLNHLYNFIADNSPSAITASDATIANENFYPYSSIRSFPELPDSNKFNLYDIVLNNYPSGVRDDSAKIDHIWNSIPFLKNFPETKTDKSFITSDYTYTNVSSSPAKTLNTTTVETLDNSGKKIAANLKDYLDRDILATSNIDEAEFKRLISETGSDQYDSSKPSTYPKDLIIGHDGFSIRSMGLYLQSGIGLSDNQMYEHFDFLVPTMSIQSDYDLKGTYLRNINIPDKTGTNKKATLKSYINMSVDFKTKSGGDRWSGPHKFIENIEDKKIELISYFSVNQRQMVYPDGGSTFKSRAGFVQAKAKTPHRNNIFSPWDINTARNILAPLTDYKDAEAKGILDRAKSILSLRAYDIRVRWRSPFILFWDINNDNFPQFDELVDMAFLPDPQGLGTNANRAHTYSSHKDNTCIMFHPKLHNLTQGAPSIISDPRNNTHQNEWQQMAIWVPGNPLLSNPTGNWEYDWYDENSLGTNQFRDHSSKIFGHWQTDSNHNLSNRLTSYPTKEDLLFTSGDQDYERVLDKDQAISDTTLSSTEFRAIDDPLETSSMVMPYNPTNKKFGGIDHIAEIGLISRGENWQTLNLLQDYRAEKDNFSSQTYIYSGTRSDNLKDSLDSSSQGGDGQILQQLYIDNTADPSISNEDQINTLWEKKVLGSFNPNIAPEKAEQSFKNLFSNIKTQYEHTFNKVNYRHWKQSNNTPSPLLNTDSNQYNGARSREGDDSTPILQHKIDKVASQLKDLLIDAQTDKVAPFKKEYTFSHDFSTDFSYNPMNYRRLSNARLGNFFAREDLPLNDAEREALFLKTKDFISIRHNYYSALILVQPIRTVADSAAGPSIVTVAPNLKAAVKAHYYVRAELVHDIYTNEVKVLNYYPTKDY